jgi:hypothetical protein
MDFFENINMLKKDLIHTFKFDNLSNRYHIKKNHSKTDFF